MVFLCKQFGAADKPLSAAVIITVECLKTIIALNLKEE